MLPDAYRLTESEHFVVVSGLSEAKVDEVLVFLERTYATIQRMIDGVAPDVGYGSRGDVLGKSLRLSHF